MDVDEVAEQPHRGNGVSEMTIKHLQKNKKSDNCVQFSGVHPEMARWLSWLERRPVTAEVVGSNPIRVAYPYHKGYLFHNVGS